MDSLIWCNLNFRLWCIFNFRRHFVLLADFISIFIYSSSSNSKVSSLFCKYITGNMSRLAFALVLCPSITQALLFITCSSINALTIDSNTSIINSALFLLKLAIVLYFGLWSYISHRTSQLVSHAFASSLQDVIPFIYPYINNLTMFFAGNAGRPLFLWLL